MHGAYELNALGQFSMPEAPEHYPGQEKATKAVSGALPWVSFSAASR